MIENSAPTVGFVGAGRLGSVLAVALYRAGYDVVACASRSKSSAVALSARVPGCQVLDRAAEVAARANLVFLTVPDDAIAPVAASIPWQPGHLAVHCSGALPAAVISTPPGVMAGSFHLLQSLADLELGLANLPGSWIGIECQDDAWQTLSHIAERLGAHPLRVNEANRALYHAGAVVVSNLTVGMVALAAELWAALGLSREDAVSALQPLLAGTARNVATLGIPDALTGPVVRGDLGTVERHLEALRAFPQTETVYRALSDVLVGLSLERATITESQAEAIRRALNGPAA
jgi:predicted short-subunit dehydrogenase-like oxidoreductase (DUF2520 family)